MVDCFVFTDFRLGSEAILPPDISSEDITGFCKFHDQVFYSVGCADNWDDNSCFSVRTMDYQSEEQVFTFEAVREWKFAWRDMGKRVLENGRYLHFKGGIYHTVFSVKDAETQVEQVIYEGESGRWSRPIDNFFSVVYRDGMYFPRFTYIEENKTFVDVPLSAVPAAMVSSNLPIAEELLVALQVANECMDGATSMEVFELVEGAIHRAHHERLGRHPEKLPEIIQRLLSNLNA